jgi:aminoglycoside phosphotransferase
MTRRQPHPLPDRLAQAWQTTLAGWRRSRATSGETDAVVWRLTRAGVRPRYLKLAHDAAGAALRLEAAKLAWLQDRGAPVPPLLAVFDEAETVATLSEALPGRPATARPRDAAALAAHLGRGLKRLHATPLAGWPFEDADRARLETARAALQAGDVRPSSFAEAHRLLTPAALFASLAAKPPAVPVLTHGDADLANVLVTAAGDVGFVDCGAAGPADPYLDLYEMGASITARLGSDHLPAFFSAYGLDAPDPARLAYYARLDEFF